MSGFDVRTVAEDEWPGFVETVQIAFGGLPSPGDEAPEKRAWPIERSVAAFDGGLAVGCAGSFPFELTVPGGASVPTAGVTYVAVRPTHRRRGALASVMTRQLEVARAAGESVAVLLASESVIYGRFGYGLATTQVDYEIQRPHARFRRDVPEPRGQVRLVTDDAEIQRLLPDIHERVRRRQVGDVSRSEGWWTRFFGGGKGGSQFGPRLHVFYEDEAGEVQGFAYYRINSRTERALDADWTVGVQGLGALTLDAYVALWRFVFSIDLSAKIVAALRPTDELLLHLLDDPRRFGATRSIDFLWCRTVDVGPALEARRYAVDGSLVLEVRDPVCPWNAGRWRLDGGPAGATCVRADDATPDLTLSATELGAAYLGGTHLAALAAAGRVDEHTAGAIAKADLMFAEARAPWCQTSF